MPGWQAPDDQEATRRGGGGPGAGIENAPILQAVPDTAAAGTVLVEMQRGDIFGLESIKLFRGRGEDVATVPKPEEILAHGYARHLMQLLKGNGAAAHLRFGGHGGSGPLFLFVNTTAGEFFQEAVFRNTAAGRC